MCENPGTYSFICHGTFTYLDQKTAKEPFRSLSQSYHLLLILITKGKGNPAT